MLNELNISNMAVIDSAKLKLNKGFTVLTGETGAGKSVLIDSINMILGHRADKGLVRHGTRAAVCEAAFFSDSDYIKTLLEEEGVFDADDELVISRSLSAEGRSVCKINAVSVSAAFLKKLGEELINIHGQQDNQKLLSKKYHTCILDNYIKANGAGGVIEGYKNAYEAYDSARAKYKNASEKKEEIQKEINYLQFVAEELFEADIKKGEEEELGEKQEILANAMEIYMALSQVYSALYDGEVNAYELLSSAATRMSKVGAYSEKLKEFSEMLSDLMYQIKDIASDICDFRDSNEPDDEALSAVDDRLSLIFDLKRKYKKSADELSDYAAEVEEKLASLEEEDINELAARLKAAEDEARQWAERLTAERKKYKKILEEKIYSALSDLNMKNSKFEIFLNECEISKNGAETAEFMMCTTGTGEMRPMEKIASGGELSRIMLAIKYVLSDSDDCQTLIFDEIDTGVSGVSAAAVAEKLYALSKKKQVICITHLAQIAAMADTHVLINKAEGGDGTFYTTVTELDDNGRIDEISRIMAGGVGGEGVMSAARDLLSAAEARKVAVSG